MTRQWGSSDKPKKKGAFIRLNNRAAADVLHNHNGPAYVVYAGYSEISPEYHLFRCVSHSDPPRGRKELQPFDKQAFSLESKAGQGGCSMPGCPGDAATMNPTARKAYCERCAQRVSGERVPCPWTDIFLCVEKLNLNRGLPLYMHRHCPLCRKERDLHRVLGWSPR